MNNLTAFMKILRDPKRKHLISSTCILIYIYISLLNQNIFRNLPGDGDWLRHVFWLRGWEQQADITSLKSSGGAQERKVKVKQYWKWKLEGYVFLLEVGRTFAVVFQPLSSLPSCCSSLSPFSPTSSPPCSGRCFLIWSKCFNIKRWRLVHSYFNGNNTFIM